MEIERVKPKYTQLFINNEFVDSVKGETFPTINPATEEKIADVQRASGEDAEKAIKHAVDAFENGPWRKMSACARGNLMYKFASLMERDADWLADLES